MYIFIAYLVDSKKYELKLICFKFIFQDTIFIFRLYFAEFKRSRTFFYKFD